MRDRAAAASVALLLVAFGCGRGAAEKEQPKEAQSSADPDLVTLPPEALRMSSITTGVAEMRSPVDVLTVAGTVRPDQQGLQQVTSLISGRIERVSVSVGDRVQQGAPLAVIASPEIADMKGKLVEAEGRQRVAQAGAGRTRRLVAIGAAAGKDAQVAEAELQSANADVAHLRDALRAFGASAGGGAGIAALTLRAPIAGIVTERTVNPGAGVQAGQNLFTIADVRSVWVIANVSESQLAFIPIGARAEVRAAVLRAAFISGVVDYIDPTVQAESHTASVRIRLANPREALRAGMYVDVRIRTGRVTAAPSRPWIPVTAVERIGERTVVFIPMNGPMSGPITGRPGTFRVRDVQVGEPSGDSVPVLAGLQAGERVVTNGTFAIKSQLLKKQFGENE